eukprot:CAMPEP_0170566882 /NCGR_PEP_ID=MMETSP0211-20121228/80125_1 /TAXON_ID=311385 /ORGANISM="Pseudokeronopsis sp., Strain OXSARD2" /LENGTH=171 /DNA_ID=CAMNT_0010888185 /DNA_START=1490 /DNA_END=2005 /DNA_ORIENTATION=+
MAFKVAPPFQVPVQSLTEPDVPEPPFTDFPLESKLVVSLLVFVFVDVFIFVGAVIELVVQDLPVEVVFTAEASAVVSLINHLLVVPDLVQLLLLLGELLELLLQTHQSVRHLLIPHVLLLEVVLLALLLQIVGELLVCLTQKQVQRRRHVRQVVRDQLQLVSNGAPLLLLP